VYSFLLHSEWGFATLLVGLPSINFMNDIDTLQDLVLDKDKLTETIQRMDNEEIKQFFGVKDSQMFYLRRGEKWPTVEGVLRLMNKYKLKPQDMLKPSSEASNAS